MQLSYKIFGLLFTSGKWKVWLKKNFGHIKDCLWQFSNHVYEDRAVSADNSFIMAADRVFCTMYEQ